jgi:uncharacterized membrane protein
VFLVLTAVARLFAFIYRLVSGKLRHFIPQRVASFVGIVFAIALFATVINGVIFEYALRLADSSFEAWDALIEAKIEQPIDPFKTGSSASLLDWTTLGRTGRNFIANGPTHDDLRSFSGGGAVEPIRVYVGLRSAESVEERAQLAVDELKRVGGFDRSVLIVAVPTGTGMVDPAAVDTVEYLHHGDVASVAVQYSYLSSFVSIFVEPDYSKAIARALFKAVYDHWTGLPVNGRPKLYLHGLSLGALGSQQSVSVLEMLGDPIQGALFRPTLSCLNVRSLVNRSTFRREPDR